MRSSHHSSSRSTTNRFSSNPRAFRVLAAGTLASAIGSPFISSPYIARADEATTSSATQTRLAQVTASQIVGQGPRVSIVQPSYSDLVRGDTNVVIAVETLGAATKSVELFVDGVSATNGAVAFSNLPSAQFNWKTGQFKDGQHKLSVRVTDINGFIGQADTQVYVNNSRALDKTAPKLQWKNVQSGDLLHGQANLQLQASDDFGVKYIVITINSISSPDRMPPLRASLINRAPYIYPLDTMRLPDGVYVLNARGYDVLQNAGETKQITFGVSNNGLNPTVIERLDSVLDKQKTEAKTAIPASKSPTSGAKGLTTQTRQGARVAPAKAAPTRILLTNKPTAPQIVAPKVVAAKVVASAKAVAAPKLAAKIAPAKVETAKVSTVKERLAAAPKLTAPQSTTPKVGATISHAAPAESAQLILPAPSLTTATLKTVAVSRPIEKTISVVEGNSETTLSKISLPQNIAKTDVTATISSTRLAELAPSEAAPKVEIIESEAAISTATIAPATAKISDELSSPQEVTPEINAPATRFARAEIAAMPRKFDSVESEIAPETTISTESKIVVSQPILTVAKSAAPSAQISVAAPQIALRETLQLPRFAMSPVSRRENSLSEKSSFDAENANSGAIMTEAKPSAVTEVVKTSQIKMSSRLTAAIVATPSSHIARRDILVAQPMTNRKEVRDIRRMISLPSNLNAPSSTRNSGLPDANGTPRANAAITMSPVTLAALGARGAAGTLPATHIVARGESLRLVAQRYGLPVRTLANVNNLSEKAILPIGSRLNLPRALNFHFGDQNKATDVGAMMVGQTSVAPFRFLFEQQGGTIRWDEAHQRITATNGEQEVSLTIGSREATVNDRKVMMDMAAFLLSGRTMVPMRFFEKALQAQVEWEPSTGRIYISMANNA